MNIIHPIRFTQAESDAANQEWGANCGPHSLAAILGKTLEEIRPALGLFKGWMNPTMLGEALRFLRVSYSLTKGLKADRLFPGICRIQWEGEWLDPGIPPRVAYFHTHWVAASDNFVLCTAVHPYDWISVDSWKQVLKIKNTPWHVTHHYRLHLP